ncbi:MAG TPA: YbfB/YjiJ family MFS transporter [Ktedonobacteraceae bacterium]|nr:YbfB/YjiJ family MFS transporter [Ktedonobacteraceae bacterium]
MQRTNPLVWWAVCSFATILGFSRLSYGLLLPALRTDLGGSYSVYGTLGTVNFVGYLVGTLALSLMLAQARQRLALNLFASCAMSITLFASGWSFTLWQLGVWRFLNGFFAAFATVLTLALTLECIPAQTRGKVSGLIWAGGAIGIVFSGLIAPFILAAGNTAGWRIVWMGMGMVGVVSAVGFARTRAAFSSSPASPTPAQESSSAKFSPQPLWVMLRPLFQPHRLLFLTLSYCSFGCGYIIYFTFFVALLEQQGVSVLSAGFIWAGIGLAGALSGWMWGKIMDRWPTGFALALPLLLGAGGAVSVLGHNQGWEYVGAALIGLCAFIAPALMVTALLKRAVANEDYAASLSMLTAFFAIGQIVGPLISSFIVERNSLVVGTASSALILGLAAVCACGYGMMQQRTHRTHVHRVQREDEGVSLLTHQVAFDPEKVTGEEREGDEARAEA